jgi:hypothetical protein
MGARLLVRIIVVFIIIIADTLRFPSQTLCASHHNVLVVPDEDTFRLLTKASLGSRLKHLSFTDENRMQLLHG